MDSGVNHTHFKRKHSPQSMMTRPALSTSDREEVEGSSFRRLVSPDGQHGRLRSLIGWQSPGVRRDSDRDMALSQGIQDEEEVSGGDFIVVDGKFLTGTGLMQKAQRCIWTTTGARSTRH